jgi:hypothetical protein
MANRDGYSLERFTEANSPMYWFFTAISLRNAANLVFGNLAADELDPYQVPDGMIWAAPSHTAVNVYVFLAGLALENLIKAEYFRMHPDAIEDGKLPKPIGNHNLNELAKVAQLEVTSEDSWLLTVTTEAITSWGRYPTGKEHNRGDIGPPINFEPRTFDDALDSFFERHQKNVIESLGNLL